MYGARMSNLTITPASNAIDAGRRVDPPHQHGSTERPRADALEQPSIVTEEQVKAAVEQIESYLKASRRELQFEVDAESGCIVVRVRDPETGEVIRQIPGEDALKLARSLQANLQEKTPLLLDLIV
nr:flagellar biosynthesis protein FlaG [Gammaproteobacteria bacterium]